MKLIWKIPIELKSMQEVRLPQAHKFLTVQLQQDAICCWVEVEREAALINRYVHVVGTGHAVPDNAEYLGSVQQQEYVWHIYIGVFA